MTKRHYLLSAILGVVLNLSLMLLPSVVLGVPHLMMIDQPFLTFLLIISCWVLLEAQGSRHIAIHPVQTQAKWLPYVMSFAMLLLFLASLSERAIHGATPFTLLAIIGGVGMIVGVLLRYLAIRTLGDYFLDEVAIVTGQSLITTGIYSRLRHPSEAGNLCIAFGSSLLLNSWVGFIICTCVVLPIILVRIKLEDRLLLHHFPDMFRAYAQDVPALASGYLSVILGEKFPRQRHRENGDGKTMI